MGGPSTRLTAAITCPSTTFINQIVYTIVMAEQLEEDEVANQLIQEVYLKRLAEGKRWTVECATCDSVARGFSEAMATKMLFVHRDLGHKCHMEAEEPIRQRNTKLV